MRKFLFALVGLSGLALAGASQAAPHPGGPFGGPVGHPPVAAPQIQPVQYYGGYRHDWRRAEFERRRHEEWRRRQEWRRHHYYRGW